MTNSAWELIRMLQGEGWKLAHKLNQEYNTKLDNGGYHWIRIWGVTLSRGDQVFESSATGDTYQDVAANLLLKVGLKALELRDGKIEVSRKKLLSWHSDIEGVLIEAESCCLRGAHHLRMVEQAIGMVLSDD